MSKTNPHLALCMINITPSQNHLGLKRFKFQIESDDGPGLYSNEEKATERTIHTYIHTYILVKSYILYHSTSSVCWLWNCMDHNILDSWNQQADKHRRKRNGDLAAHKFTAQVIKKKTERNKRQKERCSLA